MPSAKRGLTYIASMAQLIDGKAVAAKLRGEVAGRTRELKTTRGVVPGLAVVRVGDDPASKTYVGSKRKAAEEVGFAERSNSIEASLRSPRS